MSMSSLFTLIQQACEFALLWLIATHGVSLPAPEASPGCYAPFWADSMISFARLFGPHMLADTVESYRWRQTRHTLKQSAVSILLSKSKFCFQKQILLLQKNQVLLFRKQRLLFATTTTTKPTTPCNTTYLSYQLEPCGLIAVFEIAMRYVVVEESQKVGTVSLVLDHCSVCLMATSVRVLTT